MTQALDSNQIIPRQKLLSSNLHLLIVEDVQADVELMTLAIEAGDIAFTYNTTDNLNHCQQLLQARTYDAVLADYRLPQFTAYQVLQLLQQLKQEIPLILITGSLGEEAAVDCIKAGMTDYVLKERLFRLPVVLRRSLQEFELRRQQQLNVERIQQQLGRQQTLNQISRTLNSILDPEYVLQEIVRLTGECFGMERLILFSTDAEYIRVLQEWRASDQIASLLDFKFPISDWFDLLDPTSDFYCRRYFHAPDYALLPPSATRRMLIEEGHTLSVLSVPIFIRDQLFGGLGLHTTTKHHTFTNDEIQLLQQIADQAAIALYNAQSFERLEELVQQRTQELEQEKLLSDAANRAKTDFLSNISHELRTPLTGILGFSSILLEQIFGSLNAKQQQYVERIHASGKHLLDLINDLLDLTKIEAGKEELTLETVIVEEAAYACLSLLQERCLQRGLHQYLEVAPDVSTCIADRRRLKQILVNLLSNAVKFTDSGSIGLKVDQTATEVQFSVIDTGIGIAIENQEAIFQAFHQVDGGLSRKYEGTGLGLALSRKLALLHGGEITVQSKLGCGSCFTLHLPRR